MRDVAGRRERAVGRDQCRVFLPVERDECVEAIPGQVAPSERSCRLIVIAAAMLGHPRLAGGLGTREILARDEVDDTCDGVGAVDRGGAILQYLDSVDRGQRDNAEVDGSAQERIVRQPPPVQQDQRVEVTDAAKVRARQPGVQRVADRQRVVGAVDIGGHVCQQFGRRRPIAAQDLVAADDLHGQRRLAVDACAMREPVTSIRMGSGSATGSWAWAVRPTLPRRARAIAVDKRLRTIRRGA